LNGTYARYSAVSEGPKTNNKNPTSLKNLKFVCKAKKMNNSNTMIKEIFINTNTNHYRNTQINKKPTCSSEAQRCFFLDAPIKSTQGCNVFLHKKFDFLFLYTR
jgi:hypothetical protein